MKLTNALIFSIATSIAFAPGCSDSGGKPGPDPAVSGGPAASGSSAPVAAPTPVGNKAVEKLDVKGLTDREKGELSGALGELFAPCNDTPVTLAQCIAEDRACKSCKPAGEFVARAVRAGKGKDKKTLGELYSTRFDAKSVTEIDIANSPTEGAADAAVTIVEWADFECPFCAQMRTILKLMLERFPGQVRVAYKFYALPAHSHALDAARAGVAAMNQGKFWEMHGMLFENQQQLESTDLLKYAKKTGLDLDQFRKDYGSSATEERIKEDMRRADDLKLDGTPMIFINGRRLPFDQLEPFLPELIEWLKLEITTAGKTPAEPSPKFAEMMKDLGIDEAMLSPGASPPGSGSASPEASAAPSASAAPAASAGPSASAASSAGPAPSASAAPKK